MTTPEVETEATIRQRIANIQADIDAIIDDGAEEATFEEWQIKRVRLRELERERALWNFRLLQMLRRQVQADPYLVDTVFRRTRPSINDYDPRRPVL